MFATLFDFRQLPPVPNFASTIVPPLPEPFEHNDIDSAYEAGFMLGLQGREHSLAPTDWDDVRRDAFYAGLFWGDTQSSADKQADYDQHLARQEEDAMYSDRMQSGFHPAW